MAPRTAHLDLNTIAAAACLVPTDRVDDFDATCCDSAATNAAVRAVVDQIVMDGFSVAQLLTQYADSLLEGRGDVARFNELQKAAVAVLLADAELALNDGCDELLQLYHVASQIHRVASLPHDVDALMAITLRA